MKKTWYQKATDNVWSNRFVLAWTFFWYGLGLVTGTYVL